MNREKWIDVARCLGIFGIYSVHMGESIGSAYIFFFKFIVPLFFFLAGCTETYQKDISFFDYVRLKIKRIILPTFLFVLFVMLVRLLQEVSILGSAKVLWNAIVYGELRNLPYVGSLWFFTCLFVIQIFFRALCKLKNKWVVLALSTALLLISEYALPHRPMLEPQWAWNVDSAMFYIFYYALGFVFYPYLRNWFLLDTKKKRISWVVVALVSVVYTIAIFGETEALLIGHFEPYAQLALHPVYSELNLVVVCPCLIIMCILCVSRLFEQVEVFNVCGMNTLYLCGNEMIMKMIVPSLVGMIGLELQFPSPISAYFYCILLMFLTYKFVIPVQRNLIGWMENHIFMSEK
ncbi:MAG: acyltransferase [Paludibacteraceae bacterium]|nr:acyltransferase [Paludibacteraceae bacterium]